MNNLPLDSTAMRRELFVGLVAFIVGFGVMLAPPAWFFWAGSSSWS